MKGRYYWNKRTGRDIEESNSYFNQAIAKDPRYALAYSGLADAYTVFPNGGGTPSEDFSKSNSHDLVLDRRAAGRTVSS